jgi:NAD(P)-dependent dehydrogenase (short-subunit alcohol dehydrogenase family)
MKLTDQVAIITGGGRGIGRAIAERFAREGAAVVITSRTPGQLEETSRAIRQGGGRVASEVADVSQESEVARVVESAARQFGPIHLLVNNAGMYGPVRELQAITPEEWDQVLGVNLRSAYLMTRAVLPGMLDRRRGVILNISTVSAKHAYPWSGPYAASKAGMIALTRAVAAEVARSGVRVNALCPGPVRGTAMWHEVGHELARKMGITIEELGRQTRESILQGRPQETEEVAAAALFLCSDEASAITGQALNVDGGTVFY